MSETSPIEKWTTRLTSIDLPVLEYTLDQIASLQSNIDSISYRDLASFIRRDALLTLRVLRYHQSHRGGSQVTDLNTLDRVLLMIGTRGFVREFGKAHSLQEVLAQQPEAMQGACGALARAGFAAQLAQALSERRFDVDPEEVVTAALLDNVAEILLWVAAPAAAINIERALAAQPGLRSQQAQQHELGCSLLDIQTEITKRWQLPTLLRHLMDEHYAHEPRVKAVLLATALARHLNHGWHDAALPDDYKGVASLLGATEEEAYAVIRNTALSNARSWSWYGVTPLLAARIDLSKQK